MALSIPGRKGYDAPVTPEAAYQNLLEFQRETAYLASLGALAAWDQRTMIPKKGTPTGPSRWPPWPSSCTGA